MFTITCPSAFYVPWMVVDPALEHMSVDVEGSDCKVLDERQDARLVHLSLINYIRISSMYSQMLLKLAADVIIQHDTVLSCSCSILHICRYKCLCIAHPTRS